MSWGSGFANGLTAGANVGKQWRDSYDQGVADEMQGKLFEMGMKLQGQSAERDGAMEQLANASRGDLANGIMEEYIAGGGKINEHTYKFAVGVADKLFTMKEGEKKFQQDSRLFDQQVALNEQKLFAGGIKNNRLFRGVDQDTGKPKRTGYGGKPSSFMKEYEWIRETRGEKAAEEYYQSKMAKSGSKTKELKPKDIDNAREIIADNVDGFDQLPKEDQWKAAKTFAETGDMPQVEATEDEGIFGSGLFKDKTYKLKSGKAIPAGKPAAKPAAKSDSKGWKQYRSSTTK